MRRLIPLVILVALMFPALAAAYPIDRWAFDEVVVTRTQPQPTTLKHYDLSPIAGGVNHAYYKLMRHAPRGWQNGEQPAAGSRVVVTNDGGYAGFDLLTLTTPPVAAYQREGAVRVAVHRPACVGVVWLSDYRRAGWSRAPMTLPAWMSGYERGADISLLWPRSDTIAHGVVPLTAPTYWATADDEWVGGGIVNQGEVIDGSRIGYWLLLAEQQPDGTCQPSSPPPVPDGSEVPVAGQRCPDWLHAIHVGDDGFARWHPQIDPVHWCSYQHDHGADPGDVDVPFGLVGHIGHGSHLHEDHVSHKIGQFVIPAHAGLPETTATFAVHQGSHAGIGAVCVRFHEVHLVVVANDTGELLVRYRFMGDFGRAIAASNHAPIFAEACPDQWQAVSDEGFPNVGKRQFPTRDRQPTGGYYPWTLEHRRMILGLAGSWVTNTFDPITILTIPGQPGGPWAQNYGTGASGTGHFYQIGNFTIAPPRTGVFFTDALARELLDTGDPRAVEQYVSPRMAGMIWRVPFNKCSSAGFGRQYECIYGADDKQAPAEREDSIPAMGPN